jgi:ankyrin repeat protein
MSLDKSETFEEIRRRVFERSRHLEEMRERREELRYEIEALRELSDLPESDFKAIVREVCEEELKDLPAAESDAIIDDLLAALGGQPEESRGKRARGKGKRPRKRRGRPGAPRDEKGRFTEKEVRTRPGGAPKGKLFLLLCLCVLAAGPLLPWERFSVVSWFGNGRAEARPAKNEDEIALIEAAAEGRLEMVEHLLREGTEVNVGQPMVGQTPLMCAAEKDHEAIVELLLANGADVRLKDPMGRSAIDYAERTASESLVPVLAEAYAEASPEGSPPRALWDRGIPFSDEAFHESLLHEEAEVTEIFLSEGKKGFLAETHFGSSSVAGGIRETAKANRTEIFLLLVEEVRTRESIDLRRSELTEALSEAIYHENETAIKALADLGVSLVWPSWTSLGDTLSETSMSPEMVWYFLEMGAPVDDPVRGGKTPLHRAVTSVFPRRAEIVKLLLDYGADPNAVGRRYQGDKRGELSMLMLAVDTPAPDMKEVVESLLDAGADPNVRSFYGFTALAILLRSFIFYSPERRHPDWVPNMIETAAVLLANGADPSIYSSGTGPPGEYVRDHINSFDRSVAGPLTRVFQEGGETQGPR